MDLANMTGPEYSRNVDMEHRDENTLAGKEDKSEGVKRSKGRQEIYTRDGKKESQVCWTFHKR